MGRALQSLGAEREAQKYGGFLQYFLKPYQLRFLRDDSRFVGWEASRQIGKSFALGWKALLKGASEPKRHQTIIAASERQSLEVLDKVAAHASVIKSLTGFDPVRRASKTTIILVNGSKIRALPANPRTARGLSGDIYLDEFAHVQHDAELWRAVLPIITRSGFGVTASSTPLGDSGVFYDLMHPAVDAKYKFSRHTTTVHDALADGLKIDIELLKSQMDEESWAQEYECVYLAVLSSMFPWDLLRASMRNEDPTIERILRGEAVPTYLGVDIGRRRDLTAITRVRKFDGKCHVVGVETLSNMPFGDQRAYIDRIIRTENVQGCKIDATGIGMQLGEELSGAHPGIVEAIDFSAGGVKNDLVVRTKVGLERKQITLVDDGRMLADFHRIKRHVTPSGNIVFDSKRSKGGEGSANEGHADRFWSTALGVSAARPDGVWDLGVSVEAQEDQDAWWESAMKASPELEGRAPTPLELGYAVTDERDLEEIRMAFVGDTRPPVPNPDGTTEKFFGEMPEDCVQPEVVIDALLSRGEDPCWGCDVHRRICGGRAPHPLWKRREGAELGEPRVETTDTILDMLVSTAQVPRGCILDGKLAWEIVCQGEKPCDGCGADRSVCGGDPPVSEVMHGPVQ